MIGTRRAVPAIFALIGAGVVAHAQTVMYVHAGLATGAGTGQSWADAFRGPAALQDALDAASPLTMSGETVQLWVASGTYIPTQPAIATYPVSVTFALTSRLEVYGGFAGGEVLLSERDIDANPVVLSGVLPSGHAWHVVTTSGVDQSCTLDGVTVSGGEYIWFTGTPWEGGAGILNDGGSPLVRNCTISDNTNRFGGNIPRGGGVYSAAGSPRFEDCRFTGNEGGQGGALWGDAVLLRCAFVSNTASGPSGDGGAIFGDCLVQSCYFASHYAKFGGGAISGSGTITDSVFDSNGANGGGALAYGPFSVSRCAFRSNYADWSGTGGAVYLYNSSSTGTAFTDCTFTQNGASYGSTIAGGNVALTACRFVNNGGPSLMSLYGSAVNCFFSGNSGAVRAGSGSSLVNCTFLNSSGPALQTSGASPVSVTNCIFWGGNSVQIDQGSGHVVLNRSCVQGLTGSFGGVGNFSVDPRLDAEGRLLSPSPCIDSGDDGAVPAGVVTDLFGQPRIADDPGMPNTGPTGFPVDIGAAEFQGVSCYANCDGSTAPPILNAADFACFLQGFAGASPYANCDASTSAPALNVLDLTCFLQKFAAGCS